MTEINLTLFSESLCHSNCDSDLSILFEVVIEGSCASGIHFLSHITSIPEVRDLAVVTTISIMCNLNILTVYRGLVHFCH